MRYLTRHQHGGGRLLFSLLRRCAEGGRKITKQSHRKGHTPEMAREQHKNKDARRQGKWGLHQNREGVAAGKQSLRTIDDGESDPRTHVKELQHVY